MQIHAGPLTKETMKIALQEQKLSHSQRKMTTKNGQWNSQRVTQTCSTLDMLTYVEKLKIYHPKILHLMDSKVNNRWNPVKKPLQAFLDLLVSSKPFRPIFHYCHYIKI